MKESGKIIYSIEGIEMYLGGGIFFVEELTFVAFYNNRNPYDYSFS